MEPKIEVLKDKNMTFWKKKGDMAYSRNIKELLDYLKINYDYEEK